jgi:phosphotransacetylase
LKYLRNSRAQIRQLSNEKELAEENAASLTQQLNEIKAKYALISASATGKGKFPKIRFSKLKLFEKRKNQSQILILLFSSK